MIDYADLLSEPWDGSPMFIYGDDHYFHDNEDLLNYCEEESVQPCDLELVLTRRGEHRQIDLLSELFSEDLYQDFEESHWKPEILAAIGSLNDALRDHWPAVWFARDCKPTPESLPRLELAGR